MRSEPDRFKINIRCEHVTRTHSGGGKNVSPRVAVAHYRLSTDGTNPNTGDAIEVAPHDTWAYSSVRGESIDEPPMRRLPQQTQVLRRATQMQPPRNEWQPGGPDERRIAIECIACHQRIVAVKRRLDQIMNDLRRDNVRTVTLSQLRANL